MERTAMGRQSIMSIMCNEMMRRLQVIDDRLPLTEMKNVIEKYVQQLVNSGYGWKQIRDICVSAIVGFKRQEINRKTHKRPKYRSGQQSLKTRMDKKLNEKVNWFRRNKMKNNAPVNEKPKCRWQHYRSRKPKIGALEEECKLKESVPPKAVLFVQNTKDSELANQIKELIQTLKPWTGINLKIVERGGDKVQDLLHKSNPWCEQDCERKSCHTCETSVNSEKSEFKDCTKRSIIYKTWCHTCLVKEQKALRRNYDVFEDESDLVNLFKDEIKRKIIREKSRRHNKRRF